MAKAVIVRLPFRQQPSFAPQCVGCARQEPGTTMDSEVSLDKDVTGAPTMTIQAPCCTPCEQLIGRWWWRRVAALVLVLLASPLVGWLSSRALRPLWEPLTEGLSPLVGSFPFLLITLGAVGVGYVALRLWAKYNPPAFDVDLTKDHQVEYRFRDATIAAAFAELNVPSKEKV